MLRHIGVLGLSWGVAFALVGCGGGEETIKLVKVQGEVMFQGAALSGATITFVPEKGPIALGRTDKDGKFTLSTGTKPGVVVGKCGVSVTLYATDDSDEDELKGLSESEKSMKLTEKMGETVGEYGVAKQKSILPDKFGSASTSELKVMVTDDPQKNYFELKL